MTWWKVSAVLAALVVATFAVAEGVSELTGAGMDELVRDPVTADVRYWYTGFVSVLGVMAWAGVSAACLVLSLAAVPERRALLLLGVLTAALAADDAFLLHEVVLPTQLGVPELLPIALYALAALGVLALLHRSGRWDLQLSFVLAGACLAGSILVDLVVPFDSANTRVTVVEDGLKVLGAVQLLALPTLIASRLAAQVHAEETSLAGGQEAPEDDALAEVAVGGRRAA